MILALILFAVTYVLMLRLQQYRPWVALCSAVLFIVLGEAGVYEFSLRAALQAVDYNVLLMMAGTMGTVATLSTKALMTPANSASIHTAHLTSGTRTISISARRAGILLSMNSATVPMVPAIMSSTL